MKLSKEEITRKNALADILAEGNGTDEQRAEYKALRAKEDQGTLTFPESFALAFTAAGKASPEGWIAPAPADFPYNAALGSKSASEWDRSITVCSKSYACVIQAFLSSLKASGFVVVPTPVEVAPVEAAPVEVAPVEGPRRANRAGK